MMKTARPIRNAAKERRSTPKIRENNDNWEPCRRFTGVQIIANYCFPRDGSLVSYKSDGAGSLAQTRLECQFSKLSNFNHLGVMLWPLDRCEYNSDGLSNSS